MNTPPSLSLEQAAAEWAAAQQRRRKPLAKATIVSYCDGWQAFTRWAASEEKREVAQLGVSDLGRWIDTLRGASDGTVQTYAHGALAICKFLAERGALPHELAVMRVYLRDALPRVPAQRAPDVPDLRRLVGFYDALLPAGELGSRQERERLNALRNAALLHLLFSTGARISELLSLHARSVRADNGEIAARVQVVGKGERRRLVFVRPHAQRRLEAYLAARRVVFPTAEALYISHGPRGAGQSLHRVSAWKIVTNASYGLSNQLEAEGKRSEARRLREVTPHTFRHFVATWLLNEGAQLSEVSALLGHANTRITEQYYARHADDRLQELHDQFSPDPE
ncbi:MAG: tyrosine-type recombinase/integrase [Roseiflexaceae bacterium]|nr:tyrosine-type recombinase/integrase [Roseiflexaceae bacterium]